MLSKDNIDKQVEQIKNRNDVKVMFDHITEREQLDRLLHDASRPEKHNKIFMKLSDYTRKANDNNRVRESAQKTREKQKENELIPHQK